jgi:hypothetical protein
MATQLSQKEFDSAKKALKNVDSQIKLFWFTWSIFVVFGISMIVISWWSWRTFTQQLGPDLETAELKSVSPSTVKSYIDMRVEAAKTRLLFLSMGMSMVIPQALMGGILLGSAIAIWFQRYYWKLLAAVARSNLDAMNPNPPSPPSPPNGSA